MATWAEAAVRLHNQLVAATAACTALNWSPDGRYAKARLIEHQLDQTLAFWIDAAERRLSLPARTAQQRQLGLVDDTAVRDAWQQAVVLVRRVADLDPLKHTRTERIGYKYPLRLTDAVSQAIALTLGPPLPNGVLHQLDQLQGAVNDLATALSPVGGSREPRWKTGTASVDPVTYTSRAKGWLISARDIAQDVRALVPVKRAANVTPAKWTEYRRLLNDRAPAVIAAAVASGLELPLRAVQKSPAVRAQITVVFPPITTSQLGPEISAENKVILKDMGTAAQKLRFAINPAKASEPSRWKSSVEKEDDARALLNFLRDNLAVLAPLVPAAPRAENVTESTWRSYRRLLTESVPKVIADAMSTGLTPVKVHEIIGFGFTPPAEPPVDEPVDVVDDDDPPEDAPVDVVAVAELSLVERLQESVREHPLAWGVGTVAVVGTGIYFLEKRKG